jgi:intracellular septation protein
MKLLLDLLPLALFFGSFKYAEANRDWAAGFASEHFGFLVSGGHVGPGEAPVLLATIAVIVATLAQVLVLRLRRQRIDLMLWISLAMVVVLGGLTVWLNNETFIKWKPSALYWAMGLALWLGPLLFGKNLIKALLGEQLALPARVWHRLNFAWIAFFAAMGLLNLWVAYSFPTSVWVDFKVFGSLGLMAVFMLGQGVYLSRRLKDAPEPVTQIGGEAP